MNHVSYGKWYFSGVVGHFSWIINLKLIHFSLLYRGWYLDMGAPLPEDMDFLEP